MSIKKISSNKEIKQEEERYKVLEHLEREGLKDDLHDLINLYHSGVVLGIEAMTYWLNSNEIDKVKELAPKLLQNATSVVRELKDIHNTLIGQYLEIDNISDALDTLVKLRVESTIPKHNHSLSVILDCPKDLELPVPLQHNLLKIASNAFNNAILHSGILENPKIWINIKLEKRRNQILLSIIDNGVGTKNLKEGYGINRMRQLATRLTHIGYVTQLEIASELGEGTKVKVKTKLDK